MSGLRDAGQALLAAALAAVVAVGGVALQRRVGVREEPAPPSSETTSGAWFCPHGGGAKQWTVMLEVANPGESPVSVRVTPIDSTSSHPPRTYGVTPRSTRAIPTDGRGREASSLVEYFGGWVAVGWVARAGGGETGVAAEPCTQQASTRWFAPDGATLSRDKEDGYVVVMNPFATPAVFDAVLLRRGLAPVRPTSLQEIRLGPYRSTAVELKRQVFNEDAVGTEVDVSLGRVAVASLGVSGLGGIRSTLGFAGVPPAHTYFPVSGPNGSSTVVVMVPGRMPGRLDALTLSPGGEQPAGGLTGRTQAGQSAASYGVLSTGATAIDMSGTGVVAARRIAGPSEDPGATSGVTAPAASWVVTPTVACPMNDPGLLLANPGPSAVSVTLSVLPDENGAPPREVRVQLQAASARSAPKAFVAADPTAAVLLTASGGTIVAGGASSSCGVRGIAAFAAAAGVPVPRSLSGEG